MKTEHNICVFLKYMLFCDAIIIGPIVVLFIQFKGLTFTEIMGLQSIFALSIVLLEVPTGTVADKVGRRHSLVLGSLALALSLLLYMLGTCYWVFVVAEIMAGLGVCLKSGADSALLYDTLKEDHRVHEFQSIFGSGQSRIYITQAFGSLLSSFLYLYHPYLPYALSIVLMLIGAGLAFQFIEPHCEGKKEHSSESYIIHVWQSSQFVLKYKKVFALTLFSVVAFTFMRSGFWFYQPYFKAVNVPVVLFGLFFLFLIL